MDTWRWIHAQGERIGVPHGPDNLLSGAILGFLDAHRRKLGVASSDYRVLDLGAGSKTRLAGYLHSAGKFDVTASDVAPALEIEPSVPYVQTTASRLPFRGKSRRHAIVLSTVWEYLHDQKAALKEIRRALVTRGALVFVLHSPSSHVVDELKAAGAEERQLYPILSRYFKGSTDYRETLDRLQTAFPYLKPTDAHDVLERYSTPVLRKLLVHSSASIPANTRLELARTLDAGMVRDIAAFRRTLARHGFVATSELTPDASGSSYHVLVVEKRRRQNPRRIA